MPSTRKRPAAYFTISPDGPSALAWQHAVEHAARQRDWPAPVIYSDAGPDDAAGLARLIGAVKTRRHDSLLLAMPADPAPLMQLLKLCTRHAVRVTFLPCSTSAEVPALTAAVRPESGPASPLPPPGEHWEVLVGDLGVSVLPPPSPADNSPAMTTAGVADVAHPGPALSPPGEHWEVLVRARLQALGELFPHWQLWIDPHGWHARRRDHGYQQGYRVGAPAFCVHASTALDLAAQLCWQQAADAHAPEGCPTGYCGPPPWGGTSRWHAPLPPSRPGELSDRAGLGPREDLGDN